VIPGGDDIDDAVEGQTVTNLVTGGGSGGRTQSRQLWRGD